MPRKKIEPPPPPPTRKEKVQHFARKTLHVSKAAGGIAKFAVRHPVVTNEVLKRDFPGVHAAGTLLATALARYYLLGPFLENLAAGKADIIDLDEVATPLRRKIIREMKPLGNSGSYVYKDKIVAVKNPAKVYDLGRESFIRSFMHKKSK